MICNRDYAKTLYKLLGKAKHTVHIAMYSVSCNPKDSKSMKTCLKLCNELTKAKKRGIDCKIILDVSDWNIKNTKKNIGFGRLLRNEGIEVYYDPPDITTHSKLIIIDSTFILIGSTNWTYWAFERNNEANVLINSYELGCAFETYFSSLLSKSSPKSPFKD
ncbi:hypothetical protein KAW65_02985 [candidate division WOR-3 bacterium]|nr:hypothetical protein [candidate division WOR-3 bacterium]